MPDIDGNSETARGKDKNKGEKKPTNVSFCVCVQVDNVKMLFFPYFFQNTVKRKLSFRVELLKGNFSVFTVCVCVCVCLPSSVSDSVDALTLLP